MDRRPRPPLAARQLHMTTGSELVFLAQTAVWAKIAQIEQIQIIAAICSQHGTGSAYTPVISRVFVIVGLIKSNV